MSTTERDRVEKHAYDSGYRFVADGINLGSYLDSDWEDLSTQEQYETLNEIREDLEGSLLFERNVQDELQQLARSRRHRPATQQTTDSNSLEETWWQGFADRVFGTERYASLEQEHDVHADGFDRGDSYEIAADIDGYNAIDLYATVEEGTFRLYENGVVELAAVDVPAGTTAPDISEDDINNDVLSVSLEMD